MAIEAIHCGGGADGDPMLVNATLTAALGVAGMWQRLLQSRSAIEG